MPLTAFSMSSVCQSQGSTRRRRLEATTALLTVFAIGLGAHAALAQEVTISEDRDTAFSTSTIDDDAPADVIIDTDIAVTVDSGVAATLDSNNSITSDGTIEATAMSNATGIHIDTGSAGNTLTGGLAQNGSVNAGTLDSDDNPGSGNTGILIDGAGTFAGDLTTDNSATMVIEGTESYGLSLQSAMQGDITVHSITATGDNSNGVSIDNSLDGNLATTGGIAATGSGGTAVSINGLVTGGFTNSGALSTGSPRVANSDGTVDDAVSGIATLQVGGQVEHGILNDHYFVDGDGNITETADDPDVTYTEVAGSIAAIGGAPAIQVLPTGNADAVVGAVSGSGYGIINEDDISATGQNPGTATSSILVKGAAVDGTDHQAIVDGGLLNRSTGSITTAAVDAKAAGIEVGAGGVVPAISNAGTIETTTGVSTSSGEEDGPGGDSYGILIDSGAAVNSVTNSGSIASVSSGAATTAYGIVDRSGTLRTITNSGDITTTIPDDATGRTIAIDVSANTSGMDLVNSGNIAGDILFGGGADTLRFTSGTVAGMLDFGAGANSATLSGDSVFAGDMASTGGTLGLKMSGSSKLSYTGSETLALSSLNVSGSSKLYVPATIGMTSVSVSGDAVFSGSNNLVPVFTNIIEDQGDVTLISAGNLTVADPDNLISISDVPFFYTVESQFVTSTEVGLVLKRKTAADLGLSDSEATLYEHSIAGLNSDDALATAVGNITTEAGFTDAYRQMQPAAYGSAVATATLRQDNMAFGMISDRMDAMRDTVKLADKRLAHSGFWAQEAAALYNKTETANDPGFDGHTVSFGFGYDKQVLGLDALGFAFTQGWSTLDKDLANGEPLSVSQSQVDLYASWSSGGFFIHGLAGAAYNGYKSERRLVIGDFERTSTGKWHGTQFSGNLRAGYELPFGSFRLTPSNSISYLTLKQNSYEETGGGGMDLAIDSASFSARRNAARMDLAYYSKIDDDAYFKAQLKGGWIRTLHMDGIETTGHFTAAPDDSFTLVTDPMDKDTLAAGLSFAYVSGNSTISLSYDYGRSDNLTSHAASAIWYMRF